MTESIVVFFLEKLNALISQEAFLLQGVEEQVSHLRRELEWMRLFLKDADSKRTPDEMLKLWVNQIRDVTYSADDVVDEFVLKIYNHRRQRLNRNKFLSFLPICICFANESLILHDLEARIRKINISIEKISVNKSRYRIESAQACEASSSSNEVVPWKQRRPPVVEEVDPVGIQDGTEDVKRMLVEGETRRAVVSIVGMGGLGKTTLAKKVYNCSDVKQYFDCHAWVYVSQEYRIRDVLLKIACCIMIEEKNVLEEMEEGELGRKLCDFLRHKKYLIVLDDIWRIEVWNGLEIYFPNSMKGSRVLITTRNKVIALHADPWSASHELRFLDQEESWELFLKKIFQLGDTTTAGCPPELEELGKKIVAKCGGLPLAIVVLGGLLSMKDKTPFSWMRVLDSVNWHLKQGPDSCLGILALSYNDLPYYLKSCFLYCGLFPEDSEIKAKKLMRLWVAEGFVQSRGEETLDDVAEDYLEELVHRNMIQLARRRSNGGVKSCRIHDLLRDLAISEAKDARFFEIYENIVTAPLTIRRLTIHVGQKNISQNLNSSHLRSLICFAESLEKTSWRSLRAGVKLLTVLDLEGTRSIYKLPENIEELIHLKYLCLRRTRIMRLPPSIGRLVNLQTLDLRSTDIKSMPYTIWKLDQLRHLYGRGTVSSQRTRKTGMNGHLGIEKLTNLQTLYLSVSGWLEGGGLEQLSGLRKLTIEGNLSPYKQVFTKSIANLTGLQSLRLWERIDGPAFIPEFMPFSHHAFLFKLELHGRLDKLPDAIEFYPPNLTKLVFVQSRLERDSMLTLEKLPNLRILQLLVKAYVGKTMVCSSGGFPRLQLLKLFWLDQLEEFTVAEGAMPMLRCIEIVRCINLKEVPRRLSHLIDPAWSRCVFY